LERTTASVSLLVTHSHDYVERHPGWLSATLLLPLVAAIAGYALDGVVMLFVALVIGLLPLMLQPLAYAMREIDRRSA
jgi:hypothetical protein